MEQSTSQPEGVRESTSGPTAAIIIVLVILLAGGSYFLWNRIPQDLSYEDVTWELEPESEGALTTRVTLIAANETYDVGVFNGQCVPIEESQLLQDEVSAVACMFTDIEEIGLFREDGRYVVKRGEIRPPSDDGRGSRAGFETLFEL